MEPASRRWSNGSQPELIVASGDLTHRGRPRAARAGGCVPPRLRPAAARDPGQPRHPVHLPGPLHAHVRASSSGSVGDDRSPSTARDGSARRRPQLGAAWRHQSGGIRAAPARVGRRAARRRRRTERSARRHAPPPPARRAVALAEEAGRAAQPRARVARRGRRRADPRRATSTRRRSASGASSRSSRGGERAVTVSIAPGPRAAAPAPARRGARPPRLRRRATRRSSSRPTCGATTDWGLTAVRRFPRGREPLAVETRALGGSRRSCRAGPAARPSRGSPRRSRRDDPAEPRPPTSSPTISIAPMPIAMVTIQPIGSGPGLMRRPRAPTIRPPMMSPMISPMLVFFPPSIR